MPLHQLRFFVVAAIAVSLGACTPGEIGQDLDEGGFGNPTMHNIGVQTGQIQVQIDLSQRFASEVDNTVTFAFNSSSLSSTARAALDRQADWIKQFPEVRFRVYGHTDLVGSEGYNQRLGKRRADAVVNYLTRHGINRSRLEAVASFGERRPVVFTQAREERNRRTITEVSGFVSDNPMLLDGQYASVVFREYVASASAASGG